MKVETLRKSILQQAIQGKLVPQIPTEEPASVLLEKIKEEKARLIKEKLIKKEKPLPEITEKEKPFAIPESWEWVRLEALCKKIGSGSTPTGGKNVYTNSGVKFLREQNVHNKGLKLDNVAFISDEMNDKKPGSVVVPYDLLLNITGGSIGRCAFIPHDFDIANINQHILIIRCVDSKLARYLHKIFQTPYVYNLIMDKQVGAKEGLSATKTKEFLFPLPPFSEQQRIVARIEELMEQVDVYEKKEVVLNKLESEFPEKLKKSLLQYAIQGKLLPQVESDGSASALLEQIQAEKEKLIAEKVIKKPKSLPPITEGEKPFAIPESWEWVRLENLTANIHYGMSVSAEEKGTARLLRITDIQNNAVLWSSVPFTNPSEQELLSYGLKNRDIMIARTGGTIGKTYIVENLAMTAVFASYLIRAIPSSHVNELFLKKFLESPYYWEQLRDKSSGTGQPNVNGTSLKNLVVTLPPLPEQQRIVARLEELMGLVDELVV